MSECRAAGYSGSSFTTGCFCVTRLSGGERRGAGEEGSAGLDRKARSFSPAASSRVTLQNNSSAENKDFGH